MDRREFLRAAALGASALSFSPSFGQDKAASFDLLLEFIPRVDSMGVFLAECMRPLVNVRLYLVEQPLQVWNNHVQRPRFLCQSVAAGHLDRAIV